MRNLTATICLTIAVLLGSAACTQKIVRSSDAVIFGCAGVCKSANFQKGWTAYESGYYSTALREWTPLAKQGDAAAQYIMGVMYEWGRGVPKDHKTAVKYYTLAAEQGFADAQFNLGVMYKNGKGIPQDYKTAVKWYTPAAEQGLVGAQFNLGQMYRLGQGVPQDYTTAAKWYKLAAEQGGADAQLNLGVMYLKGNGVPTDYVYAHMWWSIAASNGGKKVEKFRDWIEEKMTPSQLETAQNLARECVRKKYKGC
jgi:TPR repeat protein